MAISPAVRSVVLGFRIFSFLITLFRCKKSQPCVTSWASSLVPSQYSLLMVVLSLIVDSEKLLELSEEEIELVASSLLNIKMGSRGSFVHISVMFEYAFSMNSWGFGLSWLLSVVPQLKFGNGTS